MSRLDYLLVRLLVPLLSATAASSAAAQRVWIVDNVVASGAHFPDLPQAFASPSVQHGDVLLLRSGTSNYGGGTIGKGVTILSPVAATIGFQGSTLVVANLPAGTHFSMRNVRIAGLPQGTPLTLTSCAGTVHLDSVTIVSPGWPVQNSGRAGLSCTGCSAVTVQDCRIEGKPAIAADNSSVSVASSTLIGTDAGIGDRVAVPAGAAVVAVNSDVAIALSSLQGGGGAISTFWSLFEPGVPAVVASGGSLTIGGKAGNALCYAGLPAAVPPEAIPAIVLGGAASASSRIDPRVVLAAYGGAPLVQGSTANTMQTVAALGLVRPSTFAATATVLRQPGDVAALAAGLTSPPQNGPLGRIWLDLGVSLWLGAGVIDATATWNLPIVLPNLPVLFGLPIGLQAVVQTGTRLELTNPTAIVLGR